MEKSLAKGHAAENWRETFAQTIEQRRHKAGERIAQQRQRLQELDAQLTAKLDEAAAQLAAAQQSATSSSASDQARETSLQEWQQRLDEREQQVEQKRAEWESDREKLQANLHEQLDLNRRQAEASRDEALQHAAQLEEVRRSTREEIEQLQSVAKALQSSGTPSLTEQIEPLLAKHAEQEALLSEMSRKLDEQAVRKASSTSAETAAQLASLQAENKALSARLKESPALSQQIEPLLARLSEQETMLGAMSKKLDEQASRKASSSSPETAAELASLRAENKALTTRLKETPALSQQIEPVLAKLAEQETLLSQMSRKFDDQASQKASSPSPETAAELAALREENKSLAARLKETPVLSEQIEPLLARLAEQEAVLGEMSRKLDDQSTLNAATPSAETVEELSALRGENHALAARLQALPELSEQIKPLLARLADQEALLCEMSCKLDEQAARKAADPSAETLAELASLREENRALAAKLVHAENAASAVVDAGSGGSQEMDDLRRRFEMAVQDVRELKTKNAELSDQLSKAKQSAPATADSGATGWESLKQKLLSELESDFDENEPQQKANKLTVQGAIKITDDVVAEKEREVAELRRLLDSQAQQVGEMAVGAAAVAQLLDTDELVRQERESLKRLQDSLREQLRQAEVDISLERAKLGRERMELDEKIRSLETDNANLTATASEPAGDKSKPANKRKWLTRLGLGDSKED